MSQSYKRPESVLVLVYTGEGDVLLLERRQPQGYWQSVTGSLEWGEAVDAAARREVFEETGLVVDKALIDCGYSNRFEILPEWGACFAPGVKTNLEHVFRVEYSVRPPVRISLSEHCGYQWLPLQTAIERASSRTNREAMRRFVASK